MDSFDRVIAVRYGVEADAAQLEMRCPEKTLTRTLALKAHEVTTVREDLRR